MLSKGLQDLLSLPENVQVVELVNSSSAAIDYSLPIKTLSTKIRDRNTDNDEFRIGLYDFGILAAYAVLGLEPVIKHDIVTGNNSPYKGYSYDTVSGYTLVEILRAGEPLGRGLEKVLRRHRMQPATAYLGMKRIEKEGEVFRRVEGKPHWDFAYEANYAAPFDVEDRVVILSDPMLATGGSMKRAAEIILDKGSPRRFYTVSFVAAMYGLEVMLDFLDAYPKIRSTIIIGEVDTGGVDNTGLDERGYITPGLGDAGDRSHDRPRNSEVM